eukprot:GHVQ01036121.1.p2 GENE.GHVQ01036121.1~~GHVQ01036121.1.p2  ORF type:complete len:102 (+),score=1.79 GHVQ01036121.1:179-484(+)
MHGRSHTSIVTDIMYDHPDFLGFGYDPILGNPDGDEKTGFDPGLRLLPGAIVETQYRRISGSDLQVRYKGWRRPKLSCHEQIKVRKFLSSSTINICATAPA